MKVNWDVFRSSKWKSKMSFVYLDIKVVQDKLRFMHWRIKNFKMEELSNSEKKK